MSEGGGGGGVGEEWEGYMYMYVSLTSSPSHDETRIKEEKCQVASWELVICLCG